jgi:uncharacterized protein (DUF924 family)
VTRFGPRPVLLPKVRRAAALIVLEGEAMEHEYAPVIDFWFRELAPNQWFVEGAPELDQRVRTRFGVLVQAARRGALDHWAASPRGRLALILLLDQFPRHCFRGTPEAYASDTKAQALAAEGIADSMDEQLTFAERQFFYMPLMHAEDRDLQALSLERFDALRESAEAVLGFATGHRKIVYRFGRFPHRNEVLGRASSPDEEAFLASDENLFR